MKEFEKTVLSHAELFQKAHEENSKITGHMTKFEDGRIVFLGEHPEYKNSHFVICRNPEGFDTVLRLSKEAIGALVKLYTTPFKGERTTFPFEYKLEYLVTIATGNDNEP